MKLYSMCTLSIGLDLLVTIRDHLQGIICLSGGPQKDSISGYMHLEDWCRRNGIEFIPVDDYSLKSESDKQTIQNIDIDLLLVNGWQRLIPAWLIKHCKIGAIGIHGSAYGITKGRGRSPQNWALLTGNTKFTVSLFKIDEGIDSGAIIDTKTIEYNEFDNIRTSYYKINDCVSEMILHLLDDSHFSLQEVLVNQRDTPQYLPQRYPEDGEIDWARSTKQIHDFVRALTTPYPCAFSHRRDGGKITVISGAPFSLTSKADDCGKILRQYTGGELLVGTGDGSYLIDSYMVEGPVLHIGEHLVSVNFTQQLRGIINRHNLRFPNLPVADELIELANLKGDNNS